MNQIYMNCYWMNTKSAYILSSLVEGLLVLHYVSLILTRMNRLLIFMVDKIVISEGRRVLDYCSEYMLHFALRIRL